MNFTSLLAHTHKYIHNNDRYKILYYSETVCIDQYFTPLRDTALCNRFIDRPATAKLHHLIPTQSGIKPELMVGIATKIQTTLFCFHTQ